MTSLFSPSKLSRYEKILILIFAFSLPLVNPWVRGDGVGYYAYARALVVNHNLQFEQDWLHANPSFSSGRVDATGKLRADQLTRTGYVDNHFSIGPALIWIPFLAVTHFAVSIAHRLGAGIPADGFSWPYVGTMAIVTALAGFLALFISFRLARKYFSERCAFLATLGIWFASSLIVYMYFNPSWSHAHSAFVVALFLWYWDRTRGTRSLRQWILLGLIAGLMLDMYYPNAMFLLVVVAEMAGTAASILPKNSPERLANLASLISRGFVFSVALLIAFLPTLITRWIIYGSPFDMGYTEVHVWSLAHPLFGQVLFSSDHGIFSWTPILLLASIGIFFLLRRDHQLGAALLLSSLAFYFLIATYPDWDGISSFGNRFFVSLTPIFVLGLAALLSAWEKVLNNGRAAISSAAALVALLIAWNLGLLFQWGMHLIPDRGPISWSAMASNQFHAVPEDLSRSLERYFTHRHALMQEIEKKDLRQLGESPTEAPSTNPAPKKDRP
ncbi:MAG TPA: glycosyltransferase family 39 protein [Candidatus Acidoferrales bacterium]|nr:glycosyltransferase family 39 protein [Candidatus Acidoferrales bacterium]